MEDAGTFVRFLRPVSLEVGCFVGPGESKMAKPNHVTSQTPRVVLNFANVISATNCWQVPHRRRGPVDVLIHTCYKA